jgi:hypothetical protein
MWQWDGSAWVLNETREQRRERRRDEMLAESQAARKRDEDQRLEDANRTRAYAAKHPVPDNVYSRRLIQEAMQARTCPSNVQTWPAQEDQQTQVRGLDRMNG